MALVTQKICCMDREHDISCLSLFPGSGKAERMFYWVLLWPVLANVSLVSLGCPELFWSGPGELSLLSQVLVTQKPWKQTLENTEHRLEQQTSCTCTVASDVAETLNTKRYLGSFNPVVKYFSFQTTLNWGMLSFVSFSLFTHVYIICHKCYKITFAW